MFCLPGSFSLWSSSWPSSGPVPAGPCPCCAEGPRSGQSASGAAFLAPCRTRPALICVSELLHVWCCGQCTQAGGTVMMLFPAVGPNTHHNSFLLSISHGLAQCLAPCCCLHEFYGMVCVSGMFVCVVTLWKSSVLEPTVFQMQCLPCLFLVVLSLVECLLHQSPVCAASR